MRIRTLAAVVAAVILVAAALAGCSSPAPSGGSSGTPATGSSGGSTGGAAAAKAASIEMKSFAFNPSSVTVAVGGTVTWTNNDSVQHTVTADDGSFNSGPLDPGKTFTQTFAKAGTVGFHCSIHPSMTGQVTVQ
jgi:plastocyanin